MAAPAFGHDKFGQGYQQQGYQYVGAGNSSFVMPREMAPMPGRPPPFDTHGAKPGSPAKQAVAFISLAVLAYTGFSYNFVYLARILPAVDKSSYVPAFALLFNIPWLLALLSYFQASCSDPGYVPQQWRTFVQGEGVALPVYEAVHAWQPGKATICARCDVPRPERAHHCKVCNVCVVRMDHHCPWINNCVGAFNHKYFLQLSFYGMLASMVGVISAVPEVVYIFGTLLNREEGTTWALQGTQLIKTEYRLQLSDTVAFVVALACGCLVAVLLFLMLVQHGPLAFQNITTIEQNYGKSGNPFDLGHPLANIEQVFGTLGLDWLLPVPPCLPQTDGIAYPPFDDCFGPGRPLNDAMAQPTAEAIWRVRYGCLPPPMPQHTSNSQNGRQSGGGGPFSWFS